MVGSLTKSMKVQVEALILEGMVHKIGLDQIEPCLPHNSIVILIHRRPETLASALNGNALSSWPQALSNLPYSFASQRENAGSDF